MKAFYDIHTHFMNLEHIDFVHLANQVSTNALDYVKSGMLSTSYINPNKNTVNINFLNTLSMFSYPIGDLFKFVDDDINGKINSNNNFVQNNKIVFNKTEYDRFVITPLCMDFSSLKTDFVYYKNSYSDKITKYAEDTLIAIEEFKNDRKDSLISFYPFLGINANAHSKDKIKQLLDKYFDKKTSSRFYGLKFYPPLGFDPDPKDKDEKEKVELIYCFAEENNIPITTHTDNQGFRIIPRKKAWVYTDPIRWKNVIKNHPQLKINFAHFGRMYLYSNAFLDSAIKHNSSKKIKNFILPYWLDSNPWMKTIIDFIDKYDNIYTDISFSLTDSVFIKALEEVKKLKNDKLEKRIIFGSDFAISLLKTPSYTDYLKIYENIHLDSKFIERTVSENPERFLSL